VQKLLSSFRKLKVATFAKLLLTKIATILLLHIYTNQVKK